MKFLILGAGGIGCYYGARLLSGGHEVVFVARGEHLDAMRADGLCVEHKDFAFSQQVTAVDVDVLKTEFSCSSFDLIILASKSSATDDFLNELDDWAKNGTTPILSIQNGVTNESKIASVLGNERTIGGLAVRIGGHIVSPGHVEVKGISQIEMGVWPNHRMSPMLENDVLQFAKIFDESGIPTTVHEDIEHALWNKLIINNSVNPLSALTGLDTKRITSDPNLKNVVLQLMMETARAANYAGVEITQTDIDSMFELISNFDAIKTSMLVDREKGRPLEVEDICGPIIYQHETNDDTAQMTSLIKSLLEANMAFTVPATENTD
ncbi:2-dehydropantoate 2-reductase [Vibrio sp.]|uniref:2-dehydropantoate 2-reductase n=1 Tax=Vibrio viridaestus TaxID=2487322 RepID=A0A3N9U1W4_9VIBR|nr:2-dehydropantoate 2-reductase [Vibrio viridaestus]MDC0612475.1 2-dehydropantoate 2-reductase [Vibrio sp.]RQW63502.1 2-dehydropantoate 2-reductase [Vibrio viridaestus]